MKHSAKRRPSDCLKRGHSKPLFRQSLRRVERGKWLDGSYENTGSRSNCWANYWVAIAPHLSDVWQTFGRHLADVWPHICPKIDWHSNIKPPDRFSAQDLIRHLLTLQVWALSYSSILPDWRTPTVISALTQLHVWTQIAKYWHKY